MSGKILVITGPTAAGKTALGVQCAKSLGGQVISADSMQVYKYMDIGTAKPTAEEMEGIPHRMIDVASPMEDYAVARYVEEASRWADRIIAEGGVPVVVGGTGLYIESLIRGITFGPRGDEELRRSLEAEYDRLGGQELLEKLRPMDPQSAARLHPNDKKRIVRALELAMTGQSITEHDEESRAAPPRYEAKIVVLGFEDRQELYGRIDRRVDLMLERGLISEVEGLLEMGVSPKGTAMQAIGYKETVWALEGRISMEEAAELIKQGSRRYAKRQLTWCRRYSGALRISREKSTKIADALQASTDFFRES